MASLIIPPQYRPGLAKILTLSDEEAQRVLRTLSSLPAGEKVDFSSPPVGSLTTEGMWEVWNTLISLYSIRIFSAKSPAEFADDICESIEAAGYPDLKFEKAEDQHRFRETLTKFLAIDALNLRSKALYIQHDHERLFVRATIFTDIRPVFGKDPGEQPEGAVLTHSLKIEYRLGSSSVPKEVFFVLDKEDIVGLREVLDRADAKARSLETMLDTAKIPLLGTFEK